MPSVEWLPLVSYVVPDPPDHASGDEPEVDCPNDPLVTLQASASPSLTTVACSVVFFGLAWLAVRSVGRRSGFGVAVPP